MCEGGDGGRCWGERCSGGVKRDGGARLSQCDSMSELGKRADISDDGMVKGEFFILTSPLDDCIFQS